MDIVKNKLFLFEQPLRLTSWPHSSQAAVLRHGLSVRSQCLERSVHTCKLARLASDASEDDIWPFFRGEVSTGLLGTFLLMSEGVGKQSICIGFNSLIAKGLLLCYMGQVVRIVCEQERVLVRITSYSPEPEINWRAGQYVVSE